MPEIHVEAAAPTVLFFPTTIAESTLTVDELPRTWERFEHAKRRYDPDRVLTPAQGIF